MQRGFSLVEVIVATSLLAAALVALAQIAAMGIDGGFVAATRTATVVLASQKMEELRSLDWPAISATGVGPPEYFDRNGEQRCQSDPAPCPDATYVRRWSATPAPFSEGVLIVVVDVNAIGRRPVTTRLVTARGRRT